MKKFLLFSIAVIGFTLSANAKEYGVGVTITYTIDYYDSNGVYQFSKTEGSESKQFTVSANNENEASSKANKQCGDMCRYNAPVGTREGYSVKRNTTAVVDLVWEKQ